MLPRIFNKIKERLVFVCILFILFITSFYIYIVCLQEYYKNVQLSEQRCMSELTSLKYQLGVITEYKNRMDKLLADMQSSQGADKERNKEVMESCLAMKQQSLLCQSQFEDLQYECKKVKDNLIDTNKELESLKTHR